MMFPVDDGFLVAIRHCIDNACFLLVIPLYTVNKVAFDVNNVGFPLVIRLWTDKVAGDNGNVDFPVVIRLCTVNKKASDAKDGGFLVVNRHWTVHVGFPLVIRFWAVHKVSGDSCDVCFPHVRYTCKKHTNHN